MNEQGVSTMENCSTKSKILFLIEGTLKATLFYGLPGKKGGPLQNHIDRFLKEAVPRYDSRTWTVENVKDRFRKWFELEQAGQDALQNEDPHFDLTTNERFL